MQELSKVGHYARACVAGKLFASASSITVEMAKKTELYLWLRKLKLYQWPKDSKLNLWLIELTSGTTRSAKIASIHNQEKLLLVKVEIEIQDDSRQKIKALPDMGTNITAFQPEIFAKIRPVKQQHEESTSDPEVDGSALRTLGSAEV